MLNYIQSAVFSSVEGLSQADLEYPFDAKANTIGALLMHLAATETYYSINTFENKNWGSWSEEIKKKWDPAMNLGDAPFPHSHSFGDDLDFLFSPNSFNFNFDESVTYIPGTFCYLHPRPHTIEAMSGLAPVTASATT